MKLETCLQCENRIVVIDEWVDDDGSPNQRIYWYCMYDQTHEDDCQYFLPLKNKDAHTYTHTRGRIK